MFNDTFKKTIIVHPVLGAELREGVGAGGDERPGGDHDLVDAVGLGEVRHHGRHVWPRLRVELEVTHLDHCRRSISG